MFAGNFAPNGWMLCDGRLVPISENETLFVLLGTTYGGDGVNTFGIPDLRGSAPVSIGTAPGRTTFTLGQKQGTEKVTITATNLPQHTHTLQGVTAVATTGIPSSSVLLATTQYFQYASNNATPAPTPVAMSSSSITPLGSSQPISDKQPYVAINYIIASFGIFPTQQ